MTGRGRPSTGVKVQVRIPADVLCTIDVAAEQAEMSRAAVIRAMLRYNIEGDAGPRMMSEPTP